jgi:hypothetical protein
MSLLVALLVLFIVTLVPVMIGARVVGARNTGIGAALLSVLALMVIGALCDRLIGSPLLNFLISAALGGAVMSAILGTTFWRAIGVAIIAAAIQWGIALFFFGAVIAGARM